MSLGASSFCKAESVFYTDSFGYTDLDHLWVLQSYNHWEQVNPNYEVVVPSPVSDCVTYVLIC